MTTAARARMRRPEAITVHLRATGPDVVNRQSPCLAAWPQLYPGNGDFSLRSGASRHPFRLTLFTMRDSIEDEFYTRRNPKLVENAQQIFLDGMLAQPQFIGNLAIAEPIRHQRDDLFFAWRHQRLAAGIHHTQCVHLGQSFEHVVHLLAIYPDLPSGNTVDALAEHAKRRMVEKKNSPDTGTKSVDDYFPIIAIHQQYRRRRWMRNVEPAQQSEVKHLVSSQQYHVDLVRLHELVESRYLQ